jgi:hypothetical protein
MTKSDFLQFCHYLQVQNEVIQSTGPLSSTIVKMIDPSHHAISLLLRQVLSDLGMEWFGWFFFELGYVSGVLTERAVLRIDGQEMELKTVEDLFNLLHRKECFLK